MQEVLMDGFGKQESGLYKAICTSDFSMSEFDFVLNCHNVPESHFTDEWGYACVDFGKTI